jgi:hypothetical protein
MNPTAPDAAATYRRAALAAAIAAKGAFVRKGGVAAAAAEAAVSQGASPGEAASIAVELERQIAQVGPEALTSEESLSAAVAAASGGALGAAADGPLPAPPPANAPTIDTNALYRELARLSEWQSLARLAEALGGADPDELKAALDRLCSEEFVIVRNEHVYVTERGHRYLEYASLT